MSSNTFWCAGRKVHSSVPEVIEINAQGCRLALPEAGYEIPIAASNASGAAVLRST